MLNDILKKVKNPGSAATHGIAMIGSAIAAVPLLTKAARDPGSVRMPALAVFIISMILLYAASTIYHTFDISPKVNRMLRRLDHTMIYVLIAGSYTPVCMVVLGWVCITAFHEIVTALQPAAFGWLLAGGLIYTIGGVIYALKLPIFDANHKNFGLHEIFHLFVMGGSLCHFIMMYLYVA